MGQVSTPALPRATATEGRQQRSSSISEVTGWHRTHILATDVKDRNDTGNSNALIAETHWSTCRLPTCHMSLGSLTVGMPEAKDIVGSLVPYRCLMIQVFCNAVCCWVNSCKCVEGSWCLSRSVKQSQKNGVAGSKGRVCRYGDGGDKAVVVVVICSGNTGQDAHGTGWRSGVRVEMYRTIRSRVSGPTVT